MRKTRKIGDAVRGRKKAVLYARVSSREQEKEGYSIPAQQMLLRTYALEHQLDVVREFIDIESAKKTGRAGFTDMVAFLRAEMKRTDRCSTLLVEKTDRLYRNFKDYVTLEDLDLEIHLVKESTVLSAESRSAEKFMHGIKVLMAKNYLDNLSEEVTKGQLEKARQGHFPGRAPIGYLNAQLGGRRYLAVDPVMAPLVRKLFEVYAEGQHSLPELARHLAKFGLVHPKTGKRLHTGVTHWILSNPVYYGDFVWDGKHYKGAHEPIVDRALWERVAAVREHKNFKGPKHRTHSWAFQGLVTCGHCGSAYTAEIKRERYVYYHCTGARGRCPEKYVREEKLAEAFGMALGAIKMDEEVLSWVVSALKASHAEVRQFRDQALGKLQADYQRVLARLDALYVDKLDGVIPAELYQAKAGAWNDELAKIRESIAAHESANRNYLEEGAGLLELAQRSVSLYEIQDMPEKRRLLDFVLSNSVWRDGKLTVEYRLPFNLIAETKAKQPKLLASAVTQDAFSGRWSDWLDVYRTLLANPPAEFKATLELARGFAA